MRDHCFCSYVGRQARLTSVLTGQTVRTFLPGEVYRCEDTFFFSFGGEWGSQYCLFLVPIDDEDVDMGFDPMYRKYWDRMGQRSTEEERAKSGRRLAPGHIRLAKDSLSATKGLVHNGPPKVGDHLCVVLAAMGYHSGTKALRTVRGIRRTVDLGDFQRPDGRMETASYETDLDDSRQFLEYRRDDGTIDPYRVTIVEAGRLIIFGDVHHTDGSMERQLRVIFRTPESDRDELARHLVELFDLPDLTEYAAELYRLSGRKPSAEAVERRDRKQAVLAAAPPTQVVVADADAPLRTPLRTPLGELAGVNFNLSPDSSPEDVAELLVASLGVD